MKHPSKCSRCGEEILPKVMHYVIVNAEGIVTRLICASEGH
jgi:hypothetical protein